MSNVTNILNSLFAPGAGEPLTAPAARSSAKPVNGAPSPFENALRQATDRGSARAQEDPRACACSQGLEASNTVAPPADMPRTEVPKATLGSRAESIAPEIEAVAETTQISIEAQSLEKGLRELTRILQALTNLPAEQGADLLVSLTDGAVSKDQALAFVKALQDLWRGMGPSAPAILENPDFVLGLLDRVQEDVEAVLSNPKNAALLAIVAPTVSSVAPQGDAAALDVSSLQDIRVTGAVSSRTEPHAQALALQTDRFMTALDLFAQRGLPLSNVVNEATGEALLVPSDWRVQLAPSDGVSGDKPAQALRALLELMTESRAGRVILTQTVSRDLQTRIQDAKAVLQNLLSMGTQPQNAGLESRPVAMEGPSQIAQGIQKAFETLQSVIREVRQALLGKTAETPVVPVPNGPIPASAQKILDAFRQEAQVAVENQTKSPQPPTPVVATPVVVDVKPSLWTSRSGSHLSETPLTALQEANPGTRQTSVMPNDTTTTRVEPQTTTGGAAQTHGEPQPETGLLSQTKMSVAGHASSLPSAREYVPAPVDPAQVIQQVAKEVSLQMLRSSTVTRLSFQLVPENMGRVTVQVALVDQTVTARILVTNAEVREVLSGHMIELRTALNQAGLQIDQLQVHVQGGGGNLLGQYYQYQQEGFSYQYNNLIKEEVYRATPVIEEGLKPIEVGPWSLVNLLV